MANLDSSDGENLKEFEFGASENENLQEFENLLDVGYLSRSDMQLPLIRNNLKTRAPLFYQKNSGSFRGRRELPSRHRGVHWKQSNKKHVARLCLPGPGKEKLELGEYQSQEEAARAYDVGAFYYQKLEKCNCAHRSFLLPPVPDNISGEEKRRWVRERAREFAPLISNSERRTSASHRELGSGCSSLFTSPEGQPSTSASYGTREAHCGYPTDAPAIPLTSVGDANDLFSGWESLDEHALVSIVDIDVTSVNRQKRKAVPHAANDRTRWISTSSSLSHRGLANLEEQQVRNTDQALTADNEHSHRAVPQLKMTDSICFAYCELRKQGWEWTLKPSSPTSAKTGLLFSLPQGERAPALLMTDIIISSFYELREQGWEVHLEASKRDNIEDVAVC